MSAHVAAADCEVMLAGEAATEAAGARLAAALDVCKRAATEAPLGLLIALHGTLGAGKTTLVRATLRGLGWRGRVPSPTYTLVEQYAAGPLRIAHLDLYRIADPEELDALGARELLSEADAAFVEWPHRGAGWLPPAGLALELLPDGEARRLRVAARAPRWQLLAEAVCRSG